MSEITEYSDANRPEGFTQQSLGWRPWLTPVEETELTDAQRGALIGQFRLKSPYFRLLVRNPEALEARTLTDEDIFYNVTTGLPRADREIAASAASRVNGCVYCASVHTARATKESGRGDDVQKLLDDGVAAELGQPWSAIARASAALTMTPSEFDADHIAQLRAATGRHSRAGSTVRCYHWANPPQDGNATPPV